MLGRLPLAERERVCVGAGLEELARTTCPRRSAGPSGGESSQPVAPPSEGIRSRSDIVTRYPGHPRVAVASKHLGRQIAAGKGAEAMARARLLRAGLVAAATTAILVAAPTVVTIAGITARGVD